MTYIAFLRGINVGKRQVKMELLKSVMEKAGYTHVKTLLTSGNVIFSSSEDSDKLRSNIEDILQKTFGFEIPVILQTGDDITSLIRKDPFRDILVTKDTKRYVTFRSDQEPHKKQSTLKIPYVSSDNTFRILSVTANVICSVLVLAPGHGTLQLMDILEKEYGKHVTTRNWNTIEKIAAMV